MRQPPAILLAAYNGVIAVQRVYARLREIFGLIIGALREINGDLTLASVFLLLAVLTLMLFADPMLRSEVWHSLGIR